MDSDGLYVIPFLSKELDLLGYPKLPYRIKRGREERNVRRAKFRDKSGGGNEFSDDDSSDSGDVEIAFDSRKMIGGLVSTCFQLLNEVKKMHMCDDPDSDALDKVTFENNNLKKHLNSLEKEVEHKKSLISKGAEERRQLKVKLSESESKIRLLEKEKMRIALQSQSNIDVMKHKNVKIQKDLDVLHEVLWKQSRMINTENFPHNFKILRPKEPDFNKLWSEVKYSSKLAREEALKKAICLLQDNNETLLTENTILKTLLFSSLEEVHHAVEDLCQKMRMPCKRISSNYLQKIFLLQEEEEEEEGLNVQEFKDHLREVLNIYTKMHDFLADSHISLPNKG